jgi:hypothetical protein
MPSEDFEKFNTADETVENEKIDDGVSPEVSENDWKELQSKIRNLLKPSENRLVDVFSRLSKNGKGQLVFINHEIKSEVHHLMQRIFYSSYIRRYIPEYDIRKSINELLNTESGKKVEQAILFGIYYTVKKGLKRISLEEEAKEAGYLGAEFDIRLKEEDETHLNAEKKVEEVLSNYLNVLKYMADLGAKKQKPIEYDPKIIERYKRLFEHPFNSEAQLAKAMIFFFDDRDKILSAIIKYCLGGEEQFRAKCKEILQGSLKKDLAETFMLIKEWKRNDESSKKAHKETIRGLPAINPKRKRQKTKEGIPPVKPGKPVHIKPVTDEPETVLARESQEPSRYDLDEQMIKEEIVTETEEPAPAIEDVEPEKEDKEPKTPSGVINWVRKHKQIIALTLSFSIFGGALGVTANRMDACGDNKVSKKPSASAKFAHKKGTDAGTAAKMDAASKDLIDAGTVTKIADSVNDAKVADAGVKKEPVKVAARSHSKVDTIKTPVKEKDGTLNIDKGSLEDLPKSAYLSMFKGEAVDFSELPGGIISRYMEKNLLEGATRTEKRAYKNYLRKLEKGWLMYMKNLESEVDNKLSLGENVSEKDMAEYEWFKKTYSKTHKHRYRQAGWLFNKYDKLKDKKSGKAKWYKKAFKMGKNFMTGLHELNPHIKSVNDVQPGQKVWLSKKSGKTLKTIKTLFEWAKSMGKKVPKKSEVTTGEIQEDSTKVMFADSRKQKKEKVHESSVQIDSDYTKDLQAKNETHSQELSGMLEINTGPASISGEIETAESLVKGVINDVRELFADIDNYYAQYEVEEESPYLEYTVEEESPYLEYKVSKIVDESEVDDYYAEIEISREKDEPDELPYAEYEVTKQMSDDSPYEEISVGYEDKPVTDEKPEPAEKSLWGRIKNKTKRFFGKKAA